jgi:hypothetical protein
MCLLVPSDSFTTHDLHRDATLRSMLLTTLISLVVVIVVDSPTFDTA